MKNKHNSDTSSIMKYRSCTNIQNLNLNILTNYHTSSMYMSYCCDPVKNRPNVDFRKSGEESIQSYLLEREENILESIKFSLLNEDTKIEGRNNTKGCVSCSRYKLSAWTEPSKKFRYINLSMSPAVCQCKCIYCYQIKMGWHSNSEGVDLAKQYYDRVFDALEFAKTDNLISKDATWQISSGEIAIHPYKNRIFDLIQGQRSKILTNCFIFDKRIADNLSKNVSSTINLSIDSGTAKTWRKVKGFDNFDDVLENLKKYSQACIKPNQVTLKYIVLPDINDNDEDYHGLVKLMTELNIWQVSISADAGKKYSKDFSYKEKLYEASARLAAILILNNYEIYFNEDALSSNCINSIKAKADELIKNKHKQYLPY